MFKLLYADDEPLSRYAFRTLMMKSFDNIEIIGEAEDGIKAIEATRRLKPDILVIDVKMPGINGIEASKKIIQEFPRIKIIILTAYDNFDYINQALDIGVRSYLMKPFKKDEIIEKISKIINEIEFENKVNESSVYKDESTLNVRRYIEEELVLSIINEGHSDKVKKYISFLKLKIEGGYYIVISKLMDDFNLSESNIYNTKHMDELSEMIKSFLQPLKKFITARSIGNIITIFCMVELNSYNKNIEKNNITDIMKGLKNRIKLILNMDVSIGIGTTYKDIVDFKLSFSEALLANEKAQRSNDIEYFDLEKKASINNSIKYSIVLENEIIEKIKLGNVEEAEKKSNFMINTIVDFSGDIPEIKEYVIQFTSALKRILYNMGEEEYIRNSLGISKINEFRNKEEIKDFTHVIINNIFDRLKYLNKNKDVKYLNKICGYIEKSFNSDFSLEMVAEDVGLSPQYVSKLFKEKLGINFIDYMTDKRINYAKNLLKSSNKSISEIGSLVGYSDVNYFPKIFKKVTGLTPKQYRFNG